ncbi:MAG: hypothetical protein V4719_24505 [Planctomycetota bacterium]
MILLKQWTVVKLTAMLVFIVVAITAISSFSWQPTKTEKNGSDRVFFESDHNNTIENVVVTEANQTTTIAGRLLIREVKQTVPTALFVRIEPPEDSRETKQFRVNIKATSSKPVVGNVLVTALRHPGENSYLAIGRDFDDGRVIYNDSSPLQSAALEMTGQTDTIELTSAIACVELRLDFSHDASDVVIAIEGIEVTFY